MKKYLEIIGSAQSKMDAKKEAIHIKVNLDISNLNNFGILDNSYKGGSISNLHAHLFVFPHIKVAVKVGDRIVVSTGKLILIC